MNQVEIDQLRIQVVSAQGHWIGGRSVAGQGSALNVISPIDGNSFSTLANGTVSDINAAVTSARKSFDSGVWSKASPSERKKKLIKLAELIEKNATELAVLGVRDNGTEISMAYKAEPLSAANTFRYYAEAVDKVFGDPRPQESCITVYKRFSHQLVF